MKVKKLALALCSTALLSASIAANAAVAHKTLPVKQPSYNWLVRLRAIDVLPDVRSSVITEIGGNVTYIGASVVPELDFSYFFTKHVAAELILATSRHRLEATATTGGTVDLGKVWLLPPTLTVQWHFFPDYIVSPYVGAGLNYTVFYGEQGGTNPIPTKTEYDNNFGTALQVGADFNINDRWLINVDAKKVFLRTRAAVNIPSAGTTVNSVVHLDPWIVGVGVGYRF